MRDIDTRIADQISRKILWFVVNMPSFPSLRATRTLRNLLKLMEEARAIQPCRRKTTNFCQNSTELVEKDCGGAQHAQ